MYCIENEFEQCLRSIERQTYQDFEYFVIKNLPNKLAHDTLYQTFMDRAEQFDLFIKIDADMVLCRDTFFEEVIHEMDINPEYNHFQIGVWDHFTQKLIHALHVYRSSVKWKSSDEKYFVDMVNEPTICKKYMCTNEALAPAADHCPSPSSFQAFHFGVHKAAKILQNDSEKKDLSMASGHAQNIYKMLILYKAGKLNRPFTYSIWGVIWALNSSITHKEVNYNNQKTELAFLEYEKLKEEHQDSLINDWISNIGFIFSKLVFQRWLIYRYTLKKGKFYSIIGLFMFFIKIKLITKLTSIKKAVKKNDIQRSGFDIDAL